MFKRNRSIATPLKIARGNGIVCAWNWSILNITSLLKTEKNQRTQKLLQINRTSLKRKFKTQDMVRHICQEEDAGVGFRLEKSRDWSSHLFSCNAFYFNTNEKNKAPKVKSFQKSTIFTNKKEKISALTDFFSLLSTHEAPCGGLDINRSFSICTVRPILWITLTKRLTLSVDN